MKDRVTIALVAALAVAVLAELVYPHHKPVFPWHRLPGFFALVGVGACVGVVLLSKWLGKHLLLGPEEPDES